MLSRSDGEPPRLIDTYVGDAALDTQMLVWSREDATDASIWAMPLETEVPMRVPGPPAAGEHGPDGGTRDRRPAPPRLGRHRRRLACVARPSVAARHPRRAHLGHPRDPIGTAVPPAAATDADARPSVTVLRPGPRLGPRLGRAGGDRHGTGHPFVVAVA